jgi:sigma-B regulation protein RsbU (phosphoserine phosphatase)
MDSRRLVDAPPPARRRQAQPSPSLPDDDTPRAAWDQLLRSWPGRLFIISAVFKVIVSLVRFAGDLPAFLRIINTAATIGLAFSVLFFLTKLVFLVQRRLLWRVRRKLILSYIFIGVVPAVLILGFFLLSGWYVAGTVGAYLFRDGYEALIADVQLLADAAAAEIGRSPKTTEETIERVQRNGATSPSLRYPAVSVAFVPSKADSPPAFARGPWEHLGGPTATMPQVPDWVRDRPDGFIGTTSVPNPDAANEPELVIRAVRPAGKAGALGWVIVDLPLDATMLDRLYQRTGAKAGAISLTTSGKGEAAPERISSLPDPNSVSRFGQTVSHFDAVDWRRGTVVRATVALTFRAGDLLRRLSDAQSTAIGVYLQFMLVVVAALFLFIELVALVMGLALARSITSSIHELFMGTERVRHGDFAHRIRIDTNDQLGELATSFNQMTSSIENLLLTAADKKRLEEELRIARQIQMSLLPRGPLDMPGLSVTALCVPAREVGGDYYDFFPLENDRLGVLIADVAGKGTSAALYMAELKGLVMSLSQIYQSPRQLLIEANRILAKNLDSRSFITMSYAVIDIPNGIMTYARAGHTPLIHFPARRAAGADGSQLLMPNGLVLGLQIDGAVAKFNELLEE